MKRMSDLGTREATRQQFDPISNLGDRVLVIALSIGAFAYGLVAAIRMAPEVSNELLIFVALVMVALAGLTVIVASSPSFAPFSRLALIAVHGFVLAAMILVVLGQIGRDENLDADFASVVLGLLMLAMAPYRPAIEIAAAGTISGLFLGVFAMVQASQFAEPASFAVYALMALAPVTSIALAASRLSGRLVEYQENWSASAKESLIGNTRQLEQNLEKVVRQQRLQILEEAALPFLDKVLVDGRITDDDRAEAQEISAQVRHVMVTETDRTWLELAVLDQGVSIDQVPRFISDPERLANQMGNDQRVALRALVEAFRHEPEYQRSSFRIELKRSGKKCSVQIFAEFSNTERVLKTRLAPYLVVLRVLFRNVRLNARGSTLRIGFEYASR